MQKIFSLGRSKILFLLFVVWSAILIYRLFELSVIQREKSLVEGRKLTCRKAVIPASRGKFFDRNGVQLAWTERCYDLVVKGDGGFKGKKRERALQMLEEIVSEDITTRGNVSDDDTTGGIIIRNLSPETMDKIRVSMNGVASFIMKPRLERRYVDYSEVRKLLGDVRKTENGGMTGLSGLEKENDAALSGTNGEYSVMIDRSGNIIRGTLNIDKEMLPGEDVYIELSIGEIIGQ